MTLPVPTATAAGLSNTIRTLEFAANTRYVDPAKPSTTFFAARQDATSTTASGDRTLELSGVPGNVQTLALPNIAFSYLKFATLEACNTASGTGCGFIGNTPPFRAQIVLGQGTAISEIPVLGSANYSGIFGLSSGRIEVGGNISLLVDFASLGVTGSMTQIQTFDSSCDFAKCDGTLPDFSLAGQVGSNGQLGGSVTPGAGAGYGVGTWAGAFFGPNVAELGGTMLFPGSTALIGTFGTIKN